jgi:scaffold protein (connect acetoacetyl-CoA thiolase and HMG-CoA synthase)
MQIKIRRCPECNQSYLEDVQICPACITLVETQPEDAPARGKIYSFTRVHVAPEEFKSEVPYYLAIVELDAGPRLIARLKTIEGDNVRIDAPVELVAVDKGYIFALT